MSEIGSPLGAWLKKVSSGKTLGYEENRETTVSATPQCETDYL